MSRCMRATPSTAKPMNSSASESSLPLYLRDRSCTYPDMTLRGSWRSWEAE